MKALRAASVTHIMGKKYNDFLAELKAKYQAGDNSDVWEMVSALRYGTCAVVVDVGCAGRNDGRMVTDHCCVRRS